MRHAVYYRDKRPTPPETGSWALCRGSIGSKEHVQGFLAGLSYLDFALDCEAAIGTPELPPPKGGRHAPELPGT